MHNSLLSTILLILALGVPIVLIARKLGISTLVAYLITGAICGNSALPEAADLTTLGEIGASLLLFALGMELDLPGMRKRIASGHWRLCSSWIHHSRRDGPTDVSGRRYGAQLLRLAVVLPYHRR